VDLPHSFLHSGGQSFGSHSFVQSEGSQFAEAVVAGWQFAGFDAGVAVGLVFIAA